MIYVREIHVENLSLNQAIFEFTLHLRYRLDKTIWLLTNTRNEGGMNTKDLK